MRRSKPEPIYLEIGERIEQLRAAVGMTQQQLGLALGMSRASIQVYENGLARVPLHTLAQIAKLLRVSLGQLLGVESEGHNKAAQSKAAEHVNEQWAAQSERVVESLQALDQRLAVLLDLHVKYVRTATRS